MRIEAKTLQEAYKMAMDEFNCSITELDIRVIQHASGGILGFFKKSAIIEVVKEGEKNRDKGAKNNKKDENKKSQNLENLAPKNEPLKQKNEPKKHHKKHHDEQNLDKKSSNLTDSAFKDKEQDKPEYIIKRTDIEPKTQNKNILDSSIIDNFNQDKADEIKDKASLKSEKEPKDFDKILPEIREGLEKIFSTGIFKIDKIEVSKFDEDSVLIELDGDDAALLIGKEGYRYKAISYILYNWLSLKYSLAVRLEIAQFLKNQEAAMQAYLAGIIERVENFGKAQTKPLDGVLIKIAIEKLRERFPDKYVGIKSNDEGKFVVINEFFKK